MLGNVWFQNKLDKEGEIGKVIVLAHPRTERSDDEVKTGHQSRSQRAGPRHQTVCRQPKLDTEGQNLRWCLALGVHVMRSSGHSTTAF